MRDKISFSVALQTRGVSSHSSRPQPPSAIDRLARALARISRHRSKPKLSPLTRTYFRALANASRGKQAADLRRLARAHGTRKISAIARRVIRRSEFGPLLSALMRTTFTNTIVEGGIRSNVIPGVAEATVNMRLLPGVTGEQRRPRAAPHDPRPPGQDRSSAATTRPPAEAYQSIRERQRIAASSTDTDLYRALAREIKAQYPGTVVTRALYEAGTDAEPWRQRGIPVYGLRPYPASAAVLEDMHGIDERVSIPGLNQGTDMVERILQSGGDRLIAALKSKSSPQRQARSALGLGARTAMRRSASSMRTSLMLASRRRMYPSASNSHSSLP